MGWTRETSEFVLTIYFSPAAPHIQNPESVFAQERSLGPPTSGHSMMFVWTKTSDLSHLKPATKFNLFGHFWLPTPSFDLLLLRYEIRPYMQAHSEQQIAQQKEYEESDRLSTWIKQNMWKCTYSSSYYTSQTIRIESGNQAALSKFMLWLHWNLLDFTGGNMVWTLNAAKSHTQTWIQVNCKKFET